MIRPLYLDTSAAAKQSPSFTPIFTPALLNALRALRG
jgi:hypothetical protein